MLKRLLLFTVGLILCIALKPCPQSSAAYAVDKRNQQPQESRDFLAVSEYAQSSVSTSETSDLFACRLQRKSHVLSKPQQYAL